MHRPFDHQKDDSMRTLAILALAAAIVAGCTKQPASSTPQQTAQPGMPSASTPPPAKQDVSIEALAKTDPTVVTYQNAVDKAKKAHDAKKDDATKKALFDAYAAFGTYMTYDSPVTPRQGKYRKALIEFRHALTLDPSNAKVKNEIEQIEAIYRDMGRPVPSSDED
jgi:tetratricopeptide (TPR) repeat protein